MNSRCIKLTLEYDGSHFAGFQRQKKEKTIQGVLEEAVREICQEPATVVGAGRTDARVHALAQVCHFKTSSTIPCGNLLKGLNSLLRPYIVVHEVVEAPENFHARFSAVNKAYAYFVLNRPLPSAFFYPFTYWVPYPLDAMIMNDACKYLVGKKDFLSFQAAGSGEKNSCLEVKKACCFRGTNGMSLPFSCLGDEIVTFYIEARSFLYHMVRNIAGTLLEIGEKRREISEMNEILKARHRKAAGQTAPPQGLFLVKVEYPEVF